MKKIVFITGISTDVGKTFVTREELGRAFLRGERAVVIKAVQTGTENYPYDVDTVYAAFPKAPRLPRHLEIPFEFKFGASVACAARYEKRCAPRIEEIVEKLKEAFLDERFDLYLIEGAGGLMVPINEHDCMIDLIKALDAPVILVADSFLGMLNHTILSIEMLLRYQIEIEKIVLNSYPKEPDFIANDNLFELRQRYPLLCFETEIKR